jgi:hypothetical protein
VFSAKHIDPGRIVREGVICICQFGPN